jgi:hypothetical protein
MRKGPCLNVPRKQAFLASQRLIGTRSADQTDPVGAAESSRPPRGTGMARLSANWLGGRGSLNASSGGCSPLKAHQRP